MQPTATPLLLASALLLSAASAAAQTTFRLGMRGGASRASTTLDAASNGVDGFDIISADKSAIYTWQAGAVAEVRFGKLALQPALVFSQKGERLHTTVAARDSGFPFNTERTTTSRYNWLELPLNLVYTMHGDHGLQLFAGPYVAVAVGAGELALRFNHLLLFAMHLITLTTRLLTESIAIIAASMRASTSASVIDKAHCKCS
jgi:hypothetical protein